MFRVTLKTDFGRCVDGHFDSGQAQARPPPESVQAVLVGTRRLLICILPASTCIVVGARTTHHAPPPFHAPKHYST